MLTRRYAILVTYDFFEYFSSIAAVACCSVDVVKLPLFCNTCPFVSYCVVTLSTLFLVTFLLSLLISLVTFFCRSIMSTVF